MTSFNEPTPPPDREEHVDVINRPDEYAQRRVVRNPAADQRVAVSRVTQVIWLLFGVLEALLAIRVVLKLIGANPEAVFSRFIYDVTAVFLWPFAGLVGTPAVQQYQLEVFTIIAMIVYALIAWGITRLVWVLFYRPTTNEVTSYREDRF